MKFNIKSPPFLSCTQKVPKVQPFTSDNGMLPDAAVKQNKDMAYRSMLLLQSRVHIRTETVPVLWRTDIPLVPVCGRRAYGHLPWAGHKWLNCMETLILEDRLFDMISGNSGIVLVLINMYRKTKKPIYLQKAIQIAEQLIENMITENGKVGWKSEVVPEVLAGFAHGNSGFIELFSRLYEVYPQTKYLDILSSLVEYENSLYSEKDNNWIDLRKFSEVDQHKSQPIAWCHGAAGILLSRLTLYNAIKNLGETALLQQAIKDISLAKNKLIEDGLHAGFCLCHGNMGNLLILKRYAEIFDDKQVRSICDSRFEQILEFLNEENILPTELYNPGFMTGLSGIAYALLKYKMPKLPLLIGVEGIYDRTEV